MKKLFKVLLVIAAIFSFAACSNNSGEEVVVLAGEYMGTDYKITLEAINDEIQTQTQVATISLSGYGDDEIEMIKESIEEYAGYYEKLECASYNAEVTKDSITETIVLDLSEAEYIEELYNSGLIQLDTAGDYVSLEETVEALKESMGLTEQ